MDILSLPVYLVSPLARLVNGDPSRIGDKNMAKRTSGNEVTSKRAATAAAKVLRDPKSSKSAKTAAASALTQRPNRKK